MCINNWVCMYVRMGIYSMALPEKFRSQKINHPIVVVFGKFKNEKTTIGPVENK